MNCSSTHLTSDPTRVMFLTWQQPDSTAAALNKFCSICTPNGVYTEFGIDPMAQAGIRNMGAYMRKMALCGYVLQIDLAPVRELVSLQRRCSNNLNQVAIHANTYGGIYPEEISALQRDYSALWGPLSDLLKQLSALVEL